MNDTLQQITLAPSFFRKERLNYKNWSFAFWREFFQNSVDAKATVIRVNVEQKGDLATTSITDNGIGMTRDILENVYFRLGETTKGEGDIGGFGKARIITCFAHEQYTLYSKNWMAVGRGSDVRVTEFEEGGFYTDGFQAVVQVDATDRYGDTVNMEESLYRYLRMAQMKCKVIVNGETWAGWCHRRKKIRELSFGDVHVNKSPNGIRNWLIVRISGVPMFARWIDAKAQVVVEVDPIKSHEVFTSNRDGLMNGGSAELDRFLQEIATETTSALNTNRSYWTRFGDGHHTTARRRSRKPTDQQTSDTKAAEDFRAEMAPAASEPVSIGSTPNKSISAFQSESSFELMSKDEMDNIVGSSIIWVESSNPDVRKVIASYQPDYARKMEWRGRPGSTYTRGRNKQALLRLWTMAVNSVIEDILDLLDLETLDWIPGFVFSDDALAQMNSESGKHAFLLNPVNKDGKMAFSIRKKEDLVKILTFAIHEVAHLVSGGHDESWGTYVTQLTAVVMSRQGEILRKMKAVVKESKN